MIIFGFLFLMLLLSTIYKKSTYKKAADEKRSIDYALQMSADSAAENLAGTYPYNNIEDYLASASDSFFQSMGAALNLYEDEDKEEELTFFVPALLVTTTEGFYVNYLSETREDGSLTLKRIWTECQPYYYSDESFIYRFFLDDHIIIYEKATGNKTECSLKEIWEDAMLLNALSSGMVFASEESYYEYKRAAIAKSIACVLERTVNSHGRIAGQYGISTVYGVPGFLSEYTPAQEYPSFIAMFQGYPLTSDARIIFNGASTSAAYITTVTRYEVEVSNHPTHPFSIFHKDGCGEIGTYGTLLTEKYTKKEAIEDFGAYACPSCFSSMEGVPILPKYQVSF